MHVQCAEIRSLGQLNVRIVRVHSAINQCVAGPLLESAKIECVQEPIVYVCDVWQTIYFFHFYFLIRCFALRQLLPNRTARKRKFLYYYVAMIVV